LTVGKYDDIVTVLYFLGDILMSLPEKNSEKRLSSMHTIAGVLAVTLVFGIVGDFVTHKANTNPHKSPTDVTEALLTEAGSLNFPTTPDTNPSSFTSEAYTVPNGQRVQERIVPVPNVGAINSQPTQDIEYLIVNVYPKGDGPITSATPQEAIYAFGFPAMPISSPMPPQLKYSTVNYRSSPYPKAQYYMEATRNGWVSNETYTPNGEVGGVEWNGQTYNSDLAQSAMIATEEQAAAVLEGAASDQNFPNLYKAEINPLVPDCIICQGRLIKDLDK
jgi:hypothetical protein